MAKARMAKEALKWLFNGQGPGEIAFRVVPDIGFGVLEGALTPGDLTDKIIAGTGTAIGGVTGGVALGKLGGNNPLLSQGLDLAGSVGGDFAGRWAAEQVQRGKDKMMGGKGQTAYERDSEAYMNEFAAQVRQQTLAELGMVPPQQLGLG